MHMWMWFGYDLGDFLFSGLTVNTRWAFALTWILLFFVALLYEGSKVYLAKVQREALRKLRPRRSDERRNLLCERENAGMEPTTSRNNNSDETTRCFTYKTKMLLNLHQCVVFMCHNTVGYLLMLAVMLYNVHLLLAVVFGMMLGYFLFGTKLTRLQMKCFGRKRTVICTPECDDSAESSTPPILDAAAESDYFICRTRTCIQPSHYFPAQPQPGASGEPIATCYYGAKQCPSRVARFKQIQASAKHCQHETDKEESPSVEDVQLLRTQRQGCCKKKQEQMEQRCCKSSQIEASVNIHEHSTSIIIDEIDRQELEREDSPQITCCQKAKTAPSESQEQIVK